MTKQEFMQVAEWIGDGICECRLLNGTWAEWEGTIRIDENFSSYRRRPDSQPKKTYILPLSLKDALEITRDMWDWIAEEEGRTKEEWLADNNLEHLQFNSECACCQYASDLTGLKSDAICSIGQSIRTKSCPLVSLWPKGCMQDSSPYYKWEQTKDTTFARQIADAARAELAKLDKKTEE